MDEHVSSDVNSVGCKDIDTSSAKELVVLGWVLCLEGSLSCACEGTFLKIRAFSITFDLFYFPVLVIIQGNVLIECSVLWLLKRRMIGCGVKS